MTYNPTVDVLAMSLLGRGTWLLYDTTAYFSTATVLRFGLADNDFGTRCVLPDGCAAT